MSNEPSYNLIIDTDVGSDDCIAIAMALEAKNAKVHAITTVFGNVSAEQSATNVATLITLYGQSDIPFYIGCLTPMASTELAEQWEGHGPNGMGGYSFEDEIRAMVLAREQANQPDLSSVPLAKLLPAAQTEQAVAALMRMVRARPNFYDIIALGPLTNLAMACKLDPSFLSLCRSVTWMGGSATGCGNATLAAEFNAFADAEAAKVVFESAPDEVLTVLPWEVCHDNAFCWSEYDDMTAGAVVPRAYFPAETDPASPSSSPAAASALAVDAAVGIVAETDVEGETDTAGPARVVYQCGAETEHDAPPSAVGAGVGDAPESVHAYVRGEGCPTFKYIMKRVTKHYEMCSRGHVTMPSPTPTSSLTLSDAAPPSATPCVNDPNRYDAFPYAPADAFAMAVLLRPSLVTDVLTRHCAVETQGALTRGFVAVDWYGVKKGAARVRIVRHIDRAGFKAMVRDLAAGTYVW